VIRGEGHDVFRTRQSSLDQHLPWLDDQWAAGCRNGAELWRRLGARGFRSHCFYPGNPQRFAGDLKAAASVVASIQVSVTAVEGTQNPRSKFSGE
jgi:hypothetical protein